MTDRGGSGAGADAATWGSLRASTAQRLAVPHVEQPDREATWLVEEASGLRAAELRVAEDQLVPTEVVQRLETMVARRIAGEPIQYVLGHWPFRSLDLLVDRRVLIPRPETEQVAEHALAELDRARRLGDRAPQTDPGADGPWARVVDLGTGTGALALAVAQERPGVEVWAVERDPGALAVAQVNLARSGDVGAHVTVIEGSWFEPLPTEMRGRVDLIVANPPYVRTVEVLPSSVIDWEPIGALFAGEDGLAAIRAIVAAAPDWLAPHGVLVVEIGADQGPDAAATARAAGFDEVEVRSDLAGRDRVLVARRSPTGG